MPIKATNKKILKKKAEENTSITQKVHNKDGKLEEQVVKQGVPNDQAVKHNLNKGQVEHNPRTVGISLGLTKNMDNYESLRADCWITDVLQEGETHQEALIRIGEIVSEVLTYEVEKIAN